MTFTIDKDVPLPDIGGSKRQYPLKRLKVGESFLVSVENWSIDKAFDSLTSCCRNASQKTGFKYAMRAIHGGLRVWRVK